ncbi:rho guanine nucleotide exchange factor 3 isoform X4 [Prionailurus iriomotensis]
MSDDKKEDLAWPCCVYGQFHSNESVRLQRDGRKQRKCLGGFCKTASLCSPPLEPGISEGRKRKQSTQDEDAVSLCSLDIS